MFSETASTCFTAPHPLLEETSSRARASRKKVHWAFLRWLMLGSHYLYLRRPITQFFFWISLGGLLLWWLIDLTRLSHLVRQYNERALRALLDQYHDLIEARVRGAASPMIINEPAVAAPQAVAQPPHYEAEPLNQTGLETRPGAILLLSGALVTAVALYMLTPPPLYPH